MELSKDDRLLYGCTKERAMKTPPAADSLGHYDFGETEVPMVATLEFARNSAIDLAVQQSPTSLVILLSRANRVAIGAAHELEWRLG